MSKIRLQNITKKFGNNTIIENMNLDIESKEFLVLLGPSGCGKTTLMRMIAGLEDPTDGNIFIEDRNVTKLTPRSRQISMVFQNYSLYPHMTVSDNIAYPLLIDGVSKQQRKKSALNVANTVGLENFLEYYPSQLSGGQRQRVALGRAIIKEENKIFLMDEPLSNLDAILRNTMRAKIKNLHYLLQKTIVYVTHDQIEAMTMATRIVILNKGQIEQIGTPEEIYENPASIFVASFIGSPPMNIIKGSIANKVFNIHDCSFQIPKEYENIEREVYLGVRPEVLIPTDDINNAMIKATIFAVEPLGESVLITSQIIQNIFIVAKVDKKTFSQFKNIVIDSEIGFNFNDMYFFDIETENIIK